MKQEDKDLLLRDLCARLPYVTYYDLSYYGHKTRAVLQEFIAEKESLKSLVKVNTIVEPIPYENIKPYLRPMSSMTEEEAEKYNDLVNELSEYDCQPEQSANKMIDWLDAHGFDYRGLIPKGLALEAKEGMYNNNKTE